MRKNEYMIPRLVMFFLGLAVLGVIAMVTAPLFLDRIGVYIFTCISVVSVYVAGFLPVLVSRFRGQVASVASGMAVYYKAMSTYAFVTVINIVLLLVMILPVGISIAIQCVAAFVFLIWVILALVSKDHIDAVQQEENEKKSFVVELRSKADRLVAMTARVDNSGVRAAVNNIAENMRYLSPGSSAEARDLERRMLVILDTILMDSYFSGDAGSLGGLENKLGNFNALYLERKNMY
ncbi:MAG: hypothetical protein IJZ95_08955 [Oscillospiraceae bacterium]|nr:hypothetical protein [Oscillospiraceae bacterium]